ncbi:MAG TPA: hypothetical protein VKA40_10430 [Nitrososphaera sp.]|nr:hypothetical protein [Nitrososphaera sp.]
MSPEDSSWLTNFPSLSNTNYPIEVKYRAYSLSTEKQRGIYNYIILYEMHAIMYPCWRRNYEWSRLLYNKSKGTADATVYYTTDDAEQRVLGIPNPQYWLGEGYDYFLQVTKFISRRFDRINEETDLQEYIDENTGPESTYVFIEQPIPGIAPIREILQATAEESRMHPSVPETEVPSLTDPNVTEFTKYDYTQTFRHVPCLRPDCILDFQEMTLNEEAPRLVFVGLSQNHPVLKEINIRYANQRKLYRYRRDLGTLAVNDIVGSLADISAITAELDSDTMTQEEMDLQIKQANEIIDYVSASIEQIQPLESDEEIDKRVEDACFAQARKRLREEENPTAP